MFQIKTMNKISPKGLAQLPGEKYTVADDVANEDAILVRSAKLHDYEFPANLWAIARAGAGTNNIPVDRCSEAGIIVFNTPGANANAVKELVICALLTGLVFRGAGRETVRRPPPPPSRWPRPPRPASST